MFENLYGLSCVENQTLGILRECGIDIRPLYYDAAIPMKELFFFLVYQGRKQEYFDRITRAQDLAKSLGVISLGRHHAECEEVERVIQKRKDGEYILVRVTTVFTKSVLHARGLRNDHFVRVEIFADSYKIINDIPETEIILPADEFGRAYADEYIRLKVKRELNNVDRNALWQSRNFKPEQYSSFYFNIHDFDGPDIKFLGRPEDMGIRIRNLAGIFKILNYRLAEYYGLYMDTAFILERMPEVEKYNALFEYYNRKENIPFEHYFEVFCKLNLISIDIQQKLKGKLGEVRAEYCEKNKSSFTCT
ncbi:MAG: hypothetical protein PHP22_12325 [Oscillospiraceae bacterium]|nr:hypothetical protein [Oscillospiraceae bacterium]